MREKRYGIIVDDCVVPEGSCPRAFTVSFLSDKCQVGGYVPIAPGFDTVYWCRAFQTELWKAAAELMQRYGLHAIRYRILLKYGTSDTDPLQIATFGLVVYTNKFKERYPHVRL